MERESEREKKSKRDGDEREREKNKVIEEADLFITVSEIYDTFVLCQLHCFKYITQY